MGRIIRSSLGISATFVFTIITGLLAGHLEYQGLRLHSVVVEHRQHQSMQENQAWSFPSAEFDKLINLHIS